jgi:hypothetical protein
LSRSVDAVEGSEWEVSFVSESMGSISRSTIHQTPQPARASFPMKSDRKDQKRWKEDVSQGGWSELCEEGVIAGVVEGVVDWMGIRRDQ